jgi:hypothetical protein
MDILSDICRFLVLVALVLNILYDDIHDYYVEGIVSIAKCDSAHECCMFDVFILWLDIGTAVMNILFSRLELYWILICCLESCTMLWECMKSLSITTIKQNFSLLQRNSCLVEV